MAHRKYLDIFVLSALIVGVVQRRNGSAGPGFH